MAYDLRHTGAEIDEAVSAVESGRVVTDNTVSSIAPGEAKPASADAIAKELQKKVEKVDGKGLSTNDYTNEEKAQVDRVRNGSVVVDNTLSEVDETSNKPVNSKGIAEAIKGAGFTTQEDFAELSTEIGEIEAQLSPLTEYAMMSFPFDHKDGLSRNGRKKEIPSAYVNTGFLPVSIGSQFSVYDSSQYDVAGLAFFNEKREFLGVCKTEGGGKQTITIAEDNIIEGAVYCVATALLSNGSANGFYANIPVGNTIAEQLNFIEKTAFPKNIAREVNGIISSEVVQSTRSNINVYFDDVPQEDRYYIRVDVDEPQLDSYDLYFSPANHSTEVKQFTGLKWGVLYEVRRDAEMPSLRITSVGYPANKSYFKITYYSSADIKRVMREVVGWEGKTIVAFGDSITENSGDDKKTYCDYIAEMTGANVYNLGIGGTRLSQRAEPSETPTSSTEAYAALDIVNMIKACSNQDFTKQVNAAAFLTEDENDNNETIVARMQSIDWSKVDAVIVFGGTNDWTAEAQMGEASSEASNTILGATQLIVKTLLTAYPHVKLYWFTPIIRWASPRDEASWSDNLTHRGVTLKDLSSNIEEVVKSLHIPCCDTYNTLGWNMYNFDAYFTASDGTHPAYGYDEIARKIVAFINANRTF